ncbi:Oidioi.mRNA.OKI2018_I69.PAR.g12538.t1.cds [Oikopleura dioica]|uniref:Oidioi.mRNA.OKI2018_I69.PAR.g12538.t1.cds n=1 Tax=Oikopleura dioica TaxID=34765 RepID=A0ABN7S516_OIKDI|nr:Oidioi.mRNA.OKI2018_I69.PAR.g12538.t1.cds [Oikopleura dioica]
MVIEEETEEKSVKQNDQTKVQCLDCLCTGTLKQTDDKVYLFPEGGFSLQYQSTVSTPDLGKRTFKQKCIKKFSLAGHGNATAKQKAAYLTNAFLFWLGIILIALICMDYDSERACQIFDGVYVMTTFGLSKRHYGGAMASFNGRPTVVGGHNAQGAVEKMTDAGWTSLSSHPRSESNQK